MLTWPLVLLLVIGCGALAAAAVFFARDTSPPAHGRTPARAKEHSTPRVG